MSDVDSSVSACPFDARAVKDAPSVVISDPEDVSFVLRDRKMAPLRRDSGHGGQWFTQIVENSVIDLWGDAHFERRRLHGTIFGPDKLVEIEQQAIIPGVIGPMRALEARVRDGAEPKADLVTLARRTAIRMAGLVVGITGIDSDEEVDEFDTYFRQMERGGRSKFVDHPEEIFDEAMAARDHILAKHVEPVWRAREPLAKRILAGEADVAELPRDLISVMLLNPDHYDQHEGSRQGEQAVIMIASIGSSVNGVCGVVYDLLKWFEAHPEETSLIKDPTFLLRAQQESYRIHQTGNLFRTSTYDATLPSGLKVPEGHVVIMDRPKANMELAKAGESPHGLAPDAFDPHRTLGGKHNQQGFAFGLGVHTCSGRPLVMGDISSRNGMTRAGFSTSLINALFAAGVTFAPNDPPTYYADMRRRETFKSFPILLTAIEGFEERL
jgi:cytochrome P450